MIRVAFTLIGGKSWTGGYNYLLNLMRTLSEYRRKDVTPVLFFGEDVDQRELTAFTALKDVELVQTSAMNVSRKKRALLEALALGCDTAARDLFIKHKIDVVFEAAAFFGKKLGIPALAWMPDFQHRRLPHFFPLSAYWKREIGFRAQIAGGRAIMLSSDDARHDCETFYPTTRGRTHIVSFAMPAQPSLTESEISNIITQYKLPERYFFMPNQFCTHKNHVLVAEALVLLRNRGSDITIVASGQPMDPRNPDYFSNLTHRINAAGISEQFRILGLVPYAHLAPLMAGSVALLNPSLFEGWSTTVEEARAQGIPMLLSDLPVHREQAGNIANYFDRHSPEALAKALLSFPVLTKDERLQNALSATTKSPQRLRQFADDFIASIQAARILYHKALSGS